ncbi:multifunctional methyltransferase subunit TRM112 At1g22270 [Chlorella sorokiniana]|uniref:Multifunctional methyltransferase subunit TRM112 At1g22270 n=1 Tax=Chlorella sorokiniana TaxID=3076 RepID=A0A2P6TH25_CHLSO|nr:multifunctional methyltransferase subunit TRM112 At1g22270 [Chlorella sorokiniana]|eukprot:PRW33595.1 multifunctional methyltransferase subunit TRM112 At1g22270 [Chlorella sorokiniana]
MLQCHIKGVQNGYPLKVEAEKVETREMDFEPDFLRHIFPRINWPALREAAAAMGVSDLPESASEELLEDDDFLKKFHHALLEVHLEEGSLVCPETGRKFPVSGGIPNLLLQEDEC